MNCKYPLASESVGRARSRGTGWWILLLVGLLSPGLMPMAAQAQSGGSSGSQELTREEMMARLHAQFERELSRELGLGAEVRSEIEEILGSMRQKRRDLYQRRRALSAQKKSFHEEGGGEKDARRILSETRAVRAEEARIESEEEARLLEIMSPAEVLRFQVIRDDFNDRIRKMHRERSDRGGGGSSGDHPLLF